MATNAQPITVIAKLFDLTERRVQQLTAVRLVTTGIILALLTGIAVKLRVFGPGP